jgi:beta-glucosidase
VSNDPSPVFTMAPQATQAGFFENLNSLAGDEIRKIVTASDISITFTTNNKECESKSFDRGSISLTPLQNDLILMVAEASAKIVLVNQTGGPITMPWLNKVDAVLQCWFAGQEVGNALANIISGTISPSGKLPVTFPRRIEDSPSYGNFPTDENHEIRYREGLHMGYRGRDGPAPLFPFDFGLSYTTFEIGGFVEGDGSRNGVSVRAVVRNTGSLAGHEVVRVYIDGVLKAFEKTKGIAPGESVTVALKLDKYAFSEWDVKSNSWIARSRAYNVEIQEDAPTVRCTKPYYLSKKYIWREL